MELEEIKNRLPHGAMIKIAKNIGLSSSTISQFFKGVIKPVKYLEILGEAAKIIIMQNEKEKEVNSIIEKLLK